MPHAPNPDPPSIWGKPAWYFLDQVARGYGDHPSAQKRDAARQFFHALEVLLPCGTCCQHYQQMMQRRPVDGFLTNGDTLAEWVARCKQEVSERVAAQQRGGEPDPRRLRPPRGPPLVAASLPQPTRASLPQPRARGAAAHGGPFAASARRTAAPQRVQPAVSSAAAGAMSPPQAVGSAQPSCGCGKR